MAPQISPQGTGGIGEMDQAEIWGIEIARENGLQMIEWLYEDAWGALHYRMIGPDGEVRVNYSTRTCQTTIRK